MHLTAEAMNMGADFPFCAQRFLVFQQDLPERVDLFFVRLNHAMSGRWAAAV